MSGRTLSVLLLAVICGVSAAWGMTRLSRSGDRAVPTVPVLVAKVEIPRGTMVSSEMIETRDWPQDMAPDNALAIGEDAVGRAAVVHILPGDLVLSSKLADKNAGRGLAPLIPDGMRAYTIQTSKLAANVAGFVLPGNRVDVLLTLRANQIDETGGGTSTTLLQAVEILAVDQSLEAPAANKTKDTQSVTLLVTPKQAAFLDLGQNLGQLTLSLRNPQDRIEAPTEPATLADLRFRQEPVTGVPTSVPASPEPGPARETNSFRIRTLRGTEAGEIPVSSDR